MKEETYSLIDLHLDNRFNAEEKISIYFSHREMFQNNISKDIILCIVTAAVVGTLIDLKADRLIREGKNGKRKN